MGLKVFNFRVGVAPLLYKLTLNLKPKIPGLFAVTIVAIAARFLSDHYQSPVMLFALLIGLGFHFLYDETDCAPGIDFSAKYVLQFGVALLGLRVSVEKISEIGPIPALIVIATVIATILIGLLLAKIAKKSWQLGIVTSVAVAICGASAALAISSVLPKTQNSDKNTLFTVVAVTSLSTLAMIVYPMVTYFFGLNEFASGVFIGATIHDVGQVIGAGYSISESVGDTATLVKMIRVSSLVPVVILVVILFPRSKDHDTSLMMQIPLFLVGFILCVIVGSATEFPDPLRVFLLDISSWCIIAAISAIGMKTALRSLRHAGGTAFSFIIIESLFIAMAVLIMISILIN